MLRTGEGSRPLTKRERFSPSLPENQELGIFSDENKAKRKANRKARNLYSPEKKAYRKARRKAYKAGLEKRRSGTYSKKPKGDPALEMNAATGLNLSEAEQKRTNKAFTGKEEGLSYLEMAGKSAEAAAALAPIPVYKGIKAAGVAAKLAQGGKTAERVAQTAGKAAKEAKVAEKAEDASRAARAVSKTKSAPTRAARRVKSKAKSTRRAANSLKTSKGRKAAPKKVSNRAVIAAGKHPILATGAVVAGADQTGINAPVVNEVGALAEGHVKAIAENPVKTVKTTGRAIPGMLTGVAAPIAATGQTIGRAASAAANQAGIPQAKPYSASQIVSPVVDTTKESIKGSVELAKPLLSGDADRVQKSVEDDIGLILLTPTPKVIAKARRSKTYRGARGRAREKVADRREAKRGKDRRTKRPQDIKEKKTVSDSVDGGEYILRRTGNKIENRRSRVRQSRDVARANAQGMREASLAEEAVTSELRQVSAPQGRNKKQYRASAADALATVVRYGLPRDYDKAMKAIEKAKAGINKPDRDLMPVGKNTPVTDRDNFKFLADNPELFSDPAFWRAVAAYGKNTKTIETSEVKRLLAVGQTYGVKLPEARMEEGMYLDGDAPRKVNKEVDVLTPYKDREREAAAKSLARHERRQARQDTIKVKRTERRKARRGKDGTVVIEAPKAGAEKTKALINEVVSKRGLTTKTLPDGRFQITAPSGRTMKIAGDRLEPFDEKAVRDRADYIVKEFEGGESMVVGTPLTVAHPVTKKPVEGTVTSVGEKSVKVAIPGYKGKGIGADAVEGQITVSRDAAASSIKAAKSRSAAGRKVGVEGDPLPGFLEGKTPKQAANAKKALNKTMRHSQAGKQAAVRPRKEIVESLIEDGYRPVPDPKNPGRRRLMEPASGGFYTQSAITKTGMDYAEYLVKKREAGEKPDRATNEISVKDALEGKVSKADIEAADAALIARKTGKAPAQPKLEAQPRTGKKSIDKTPRPLPLDRVPESRVTGTKTISVIEGKGKKTKSKPMTPDTLRRKEAQLKKAYAAAKAARKESLRHEPGSPEHYLAIQREADLKANAAKLRKQLRDHNRLSRAAKDAYVKDVQGVIAREGLEQPRYVKSFDNRGGALDSEPRFARNRMAMVQHKDMDKVRQMGTADMSYKATVANSIYAPRMKRIVHRLTSEFAAREAVKVRTKGGERRLLTSNEIRRAVNRGEIDPNQFAVFHSQHFKQAVLDPNKDGTELDALIRGGAAEKDYDLLEHLEKLEKDIRDRSADKGHKYIVVRKEAVKEFAHQFDGKDNILAKANRATSRVLLGYNPSWVAAQLIAEGVPAAVAIGINPMRWSRIAKTLAEGRDLPDKDRAAVDALAGQTAGTNTIPKPGVDLKGNQLSQDVPLTPGSRSWNEVKSFAKGEALSRFDRLKGGGIRRAVLAAKVDKEFNGFLKGLGGTLKLDDAMRRKLKGKSLAEQQAILARHPQTARQLESYLDDVMGNWRAITRLERTPASLVAFYPYVRYSLKSAFWGFPKQHPIKSTILAFLSQQNAEQLEKLIPGEPPDWLDYAFPVTFAENDEGEVEGQVIPAGERFAMGLNAVVAGIGSGELNRIITGMNPGLGLVYQGVSGNSPFDGEQMSSDPLDKGLLTIAAAVAMFAPAKIMDEIVGDTNLDVNLGPLKKLPLTITDIKPRKTFGDGTVIGGQSETAKAFDEANPSRVQRMFGNILAPQNEKDYQEQIALERTLEAEDYSSLPGSSKAKEDRQWWEPSSSSKGKEWWQE